MYQSSAVSNTYLFHPHVGEKGPTGGKRANMPSATLSAALYDIFVLPARMRCKVRPKFARMWAFIIGPNFPETSVGAFIDGTISYTLSKTWYDLITAYIFGLSPVPYCRPETEPRGCHTANASIKFAYAFLLLLPTAAAKHASTLKSLQWFPGIDSVPSMVGMLAGWGLGDAFVQLFEEFRTGSFEGFCQAPPYDGADPDCTLLDMVRAAYERRRVAALSTRWYRLSHTSRYSTRIIPHPWPLPPPPPPLLP